MKTKAGCLVIALAAAAAIGQTTSRTTFAFKRERDVRLPGAPSCDQLFLDAASRRLYLAHGTAIDVFDLSKGERVREVPGLNDARGVAVAPGLTRGFAASNRNDRLVVFDLDTLAVAREIETGKSPDAVAFVASVNQVWVMNGKSRSISCIDAGTLSVVQTLPLDGRPEMAVEIRAHARVFVNLQDKNAIAVLDAKERKQVATYPLAPCEAPTGLAVDAGNARLYVGCSRRVAVVDATTGRLIAAPEIAGTCYGVAYDPVEKLVFAACDKVTEVIQEQEPDVFRPVARIPTEHGARTCAFDPDTRRLHVAVRPGRSVKGDVRLLTFARDFSR